MNTGSSPLARGTHRRQSAPCPPRRFIPARAGNTSASSSAPSPITVHPRSRGEHSRLSSTVPEVIGSSPLARGTLQMPGPPAGPLRFIPARAGNTTSTPPRRRSRSVHPRSRGEHRQGRVRYIRQGGSSPLARGTHPRKQFFHLLRRFIPARAGNTRQGRPGATPATVHPRSRGEHAPRPRWTTSSDGSSPLARGTPGVPAGARAPVRFIPARAGNTAPPAPRTGWCPVHPRSRGEHALIAERAPDQVGSSPLARGTPAHWQRIGHRRRFIPARAGNTAPTRGSWGGRPVHPRSRGEHSLPPRPAIRAVGSSPLARGTRLPDRGGEQPRRFIPARAGNTWPGSPPTTPGTVHPRSRGEHRLPPACGPVRDGSSPLARGTRILTQNEGRRKRFIPARAGNTTSSAGCAIAPAVHPRSRGEHPEARPALRLLDGSSPLARGTLQVAVLLLHLVRFIPARAGNTRRRMCAPCRPAVHPRSRGEHSRGRSRPLPAPGSSPLARGTPRSESRARAGLRFIPARAGNTRIGP